MIKLNIRQKLSLIIASVLIPLLLYVAVQTVSRYRGDISETQESLEDLAVLLKTSLLNKLDVIWTGEEIMGKAILSEFHDPQEISAYLENALPMQDWMLEYQWVGPDGMILASSNSGSVGKRITVTQDYFRLLKTEKNVLSDLYFSGNKKKQILRISHAVRNDEKLEGFLACLVDPDRLDDIFLTNRVGSEYRFGFTDSNGRLVYVSDPDYMHLQGNPPDQASPVWRALKNKAVTNSDYLSPMDHKRHISVAIPVEPIGWACFIGVPRESVMGKLWSEFMTALILLIAITIASIVLACIFSAHLLQSIRKLKNAAEAVTNGDYSVKTAIDSRDELAVAGKTFDLMTDRLSSLLTEKEEVSRLKSMFFATVSHELRTPLNILQSSGQLLEKLDVQNMDRENLDQHLKKYAKYIKQNSFRLFRLVNNMIDVNKIEANHFTLSPVNQDIIMVVEGVTLSTADYFNSKEIELVFDTETEEKIITFDPDKIERVMLNLLSNAIKFTPQHGKVEVYISEEPDRVLISVRDSGIGIPPEMHERIFHYFTQVDNTLQRESEGSGIGLALVKSIIELHGGSISIESEPGKGSTFSFWLPCTLASDSEQPAFSEVHTNVEKAKIEFSDIYQN